jgi:hypothetical protein
MLAETFGIIQWQIDLTALKELLQSQFKLFQFRFSISAQTAVSNA